jgi:hypothetical protein
MMGFASILFSLEGCLIFFNYLKKLWHLYVFGLRASPPVLSMWLQTVKFIATKSWSVGLAQEIGFIAPNSGSLSWQVKGATQLCTSQKEGNKLDLTAAQYFWLVDHNGDGPGGLLLVVPTYMQFQLQFYPTWHTEHRWRCS